MIKFISINIFLVGLILVSSSVNQRVHGFDNARAVSNTSYERLAKKTNSEPCGTFNDLAKRVDTCAKPLLDILAGTLEKWPETDDDAMKLCDDVSRGIML